MRFRQLSGNGDWSFGHGLQEYATKNDAIGFNIQTNLLSFLKDCWFAPNAGIDWLRLLGTPGTMQEIQLNVKGIILQCYGVTKVNSVFANKVGRGLTITYNINTIFSQNFSNTVEVL